MTPRSFVAALAAQVFLAAPMVFGQAPPPATEAGASQLALGNIPAKGAAKLTVTSPAFKPGGDIPFENTQYRGNVFPGLTWTAGPAATKSYVVIMQDGDAMVRGAPILHWTMANIPATTLPAEALAGYDALIGAMKDHVLASGETIGLGQVAPPPGGAQ
jgi:phosphatidylethanolamine-binding protein (PEBP) family uncharacterized protein